MLDYHIRQAKDSLWERAEVNALRVVPLDEASAIYGDRTAFPKKVSEKAVADTAKNLGLAMLFDGLHIPLRDTAYKSLTDRAKIGGTALPKLKRGDLADTLNACFALHNDQALLLIRDEKVSAVHSGDEKDYSILPIDELLTSVKAKLDERFSGNIFESGYTDHSITSAAWSLPDQKDDLLGAYSKTLQAQGKATSAAKLVPGIRFFTSDTGNASAKVAALLIGLQHPIHIGAMVSTEHRGQKKVADFSEKLDLLFAQFADSVTRLENLTTIYLDYPINAMKAVCKELSMPKKPALEAIAMFEMASGGGTATAHDIFFAMQEIMFICKTENAPASKMLRLEENLARALKLKWSNYDFAKEVSW
jgi:hypothetical protein